MVEMSIITECLIRITVIGNNVILQEKLGFTGRIEVREKDFDFLIRSDLNKQIRSRFNLLLTSYAEDGT